MTTPARAGSDKKTPAYAVDVSTTVRGLPITAGQAKRAALAVLEHLKAGRAMLSVSFVGRARMARLHREHLGHRGPTDVIAFKLKDRRAMVGDIYICPAEAKTNAQRQRVRFDEEVIRLIVHGVLHVAGWDHPPGVSRTESAMWRTQEEIVARIA